MMGAGSSPAAGGVFRLPADWAAPGNPGAAPTTPPDDAATVPPGGGAAATSNGTQSPTAAPGANQPPTKTAPPDAPLQQQSGRPGFHTGAKGMQPKTVHGAAYQSSQNKSQPQDSGQNPGAPAPPTGAAHPARKDRRWACWCCWAPRSLAPAAP